MRSQARLTSGRPARLAVLGWVDARDEATGRRQRVVYALNAAGRGALRAWLARPPTSFALEMEGLVRIYLGSQGRPADLLQTLEAMQTEPVAMLHIAGDIIPAYLAGRPPPPADEVHVRALLFDFLTHFAAFVRDWAERNRTEVKRWAGEDVAVRDRRALRRMQAMPRMEGP